MNAPVRLSTGSPLSEILSGESTGRWGGAQSEHGGGRSPNMRGGAVRTYGFLLVGCSGFDSLRTTALVRGIGGGDARSMMPPSTSSTFASG